jgi:hypothetical protein
MTAINDLPGMIRSKVRVSNVPPRLLGVTLDHPEVKPYLELVRPLDVVQKWAQMVRDGKIVHSVGAVETCGKGLWLVGNQSTKIATAVAQQLLIEGAITSLFYTGVEDYLDSQRPGADTTYEGHRDDELWILKGYGTERRSESGWAVDTLDALISRRYDKGLPTIVASIFKPQDSFHGNLAADIFYSGVIMEVTHEED